MQAVILAAGRGKRMRSPLPKPLVKVCGTTLLEHQLKHAKKLNIAEVYIVVEYLQEKIREFVRQFYIPGLQVNFVSQGSYDNLLVGLLSTERYIHQKFIVMHADNLLYGDLFPLIEAAKKHEYVFLIKDGNKPTQENNGHYLNLAKMDWHIGGYYVLSPSVFDILKEIVDPNKEQSLSWMITALINYNKKPYGVLLDGHCLNINTQADLALAKQLCNKFKKDWFLGETL